MDRKVYATFGDGTVVDPDTGEVATGHIYIAKERPQRSQFGTQWHSMSEKAHSEFAKRRHELGIDGFGVMHALLGILDYENMIHVSQAEIARELNMHPSHVSRAIKRLVEFGAIEKGPIISGRQSYRLSPLVGWKGKNENHRRALAENKQTTHLRLIT